MARNISQLLAPWIECLKPQKKTREKKNYFRNFLIVFQVPNILHVFNGNTANHIVTETEISKRVYKEYKKRAGVRAMKIKTRTHKHR